MPPPRRYWHVAWSAARAHDRPNDRRERTRTFTRADDAGAQVRALQSWSPSHVHVHGVWCTVGHDDEGLVWSAFYGPAFLNVTPDVQDRHTLLEQHRADALASHTPGEEP